VDIDESAEEVVPVGKELARVYLTEIMGVSVVGFWEKGKSISTGVLN